jgi:hypothetical protein
MQKKCLVSKKMLKRLKKKLYLSVYHQYTLIKNKKPETIG